ncbi:MAG: hypothetical protein DSY34_04940 [Desulfurobacterium sp.]|nr:MAG: hypothetical protein DSY34_04940 [Desulfurobacterium sp.]
MKSFNDGLAKGLGIGATVVGLMMMTMFSLLPLGIFSQVLDLEHYMGLKISLAAIFALITFSFYVKYVKSMKLPPIVWGFGTMISLLMSGVLFFVTVDVILKIIGLE